MERAIKYYQGLSRLLTWRLRSPLSEPDLTKTFNLRDHVEAELDYLVSVQEEEHKMVPV